MVWCGVVWCVLNVYYMYSNTAVIKCCSDEGSLVNGSKLEGWKESKELNETKASFAC